MRTPPRTRLGFLVRSAGRLIARMGLGVMAGGGGFLELGRRG
ncbi:MAG: hypothetical protein AAGB48_00950 [Planctomycetota bacterium]